MSDQAPAPSESPSPAPGAPQPGAPAEGAPAPAPPAPAPEGASAAPPEPPKPPTGPSDQDWAAYHRKVKEHRQAVETFKAQQQQLKVWEDRAARAKTAPWEVARELFGDDWYDRATVDHVRAGQPPTTDDRVNELQKKLDAIEAEKRTENERAQAAQRQQTIEAAKSGAIALAKKDAAKFKGIAHLGDGAKETVWAVAQELQPEHGEELTDSLVLEQTETRLFALWQRLNEVYGAAPPASDGKNGASANGSKTLTARGVSGQAPSPLNGDELPLRAEDRDREILKQYRFYRD